MDRASRVIGVVFVLFGAIPALAQDDNDFKFFEEEARVVTPARREEPISDAPVAVEVVTPEEIAASGSDNLWDLLRYRPGMNVIDGHTPHAMRAIVSIRGFAEGFARNVLVLVDGRNAYSSNGGGVFWSQLPVQLQDVERIEIIRGPNAALYGTGAGLGVINIITKKPAGRLAGAVRGSGGNRGAVGSAESFDGSARSFDYHLSHTYRGAEGFPSVAQGGGATSDGFFQSNKANFRSQWKPTQNTNLELFAGGSWNTDGVPISGVPSVSDRLDEHFEMAKLGVTLSENSSLEFLSSHKDYTNEFSPNAVGAVDHVRDYQYDEEVAHRFDWGDGRMNSSYGFNYEKTKVDSQAEYAGNSNVEYQIYRGFFNQTARAGQYVTMVGAASWEATDRGAPHPNYQAAALFKPEPGQAYRVTYSVAHTIPTLRLMDVHELLDSTTLRAGNRSIAPETLVSYETGYRGDWLDRHLESDVSLYYTVIKDIDDDVNQGPAPGIPGAQQVGFVNSNQAIARGAEAQLKYRLTPRRSVYANYTYEHLTDRSGNVGEVTKNTPAHAANFGAMTDLPRGFSASFNLGYKDNYLIANQAQVLAVPAYWRLDARLAWTPPWYKNATIFLAGQNLLKDQHREFADGLAVPRTYSGGVSIKFNGRD